MYAIVRSGGRQHKVSVGDTLELDRSTTSVGGTLHLPAVLLVDDGTVTSDAATLAGVTVTAEVLGDARGPKIHILTYRNKTGYRRRMGHRQQLTRVRITGIDTPGSRKAAAATAAKARTGEPGEELGAEVTANTPGIEPPVEAQTPPATAETDTEG
jgi:large subunit ribosomal protein L21